MKRIAGPVLLALAVILGPGCGSRSAVQPDKKKPEASAKATPAVLSAAAAEPAKEPVTRTWGDYFFEKGNYARSVAYLREEVKKDPQNYVKWRHLGSAYGQAEDYPNAIVCYKKTLEINPVDLKAAYDLSLMLDFKGDFKEAQEAAESGLSHDPDNAELHASYGSILADQGKDSEAMKEYDRALELRPNDEITRFNKGGLHFKLKEMDKAEAEYRKVLKMNPGDLEAAENLASIYIMQNRLADAEKLNQWVIKKAPKDEDTLENAYFNLGIVYDKQDKVRPALDMYKLALQAAPWDAAAYVNAAVILERLGRAGEALAYWEKYDRLFPMNRRQEELKKRIAALKAMVEQQNETGEKPSPLPTPKN
jgi:tetratricopeptide (TPR) repeat protein